MMSGSGSYNNIPILLKKVRSLKFVSVKEIQKIEVLSDSIFREWSKLREQFRKKILRNTASTKQLYLKQEAEEEIILGLINLLNQKLINFLLSYK